MGQGCALTAQGQVGCRLVGARRLLLQAWLASIEACQLRRAPKPCWLLLLLRLATPTPETRHKGLCAQPSLKESSTFGVTDVLPVSLARQQAICVHQMYRCCKAASPGGQGHSRLAPPACAHHSYAGRGACQFKECLLPELRKSRLDDTAGPVPCR